MLISQSYVEQNKKLHEAIPEYGARGNRHAHQIRALMEEHDCSTLLDYGCGKGSLATEIPGAQGYDPALPAFCVLPEDRVVDGRTIWPFDLVSCTDVLEHIEPDCLDSVLAHIAKLARKAVFLVIATRPARKTLPDGRNAHLIVQNAGWWLDKLQNYVKPIDVRATEEELRVVGYPMKAVGDFPTKSAVEPEVRGNNMRHALSLGLPEVEVVAPHGRTMVVCAFGPSFQHTWQQALHVRGDIFTCSGSHDFLLERGVKPVGHAECDPRPHKAKFLTKPQAGVTYYPASCCDPQMFEQLKGFDTRLWHLDQGPYSEEIVKENALNRGIKGPFLIGGGSTIGLRTIALGTVLGYRHFALFGLDCSFQQVDGKDIRHAGEHHGKAPRQILDVRSGDKWYRTSGALIYAARNFIETLNELNRVMPGVYSFDIYGDGLLRQMLAVGGAGVEVEHDAPLEKAA